QHRGGRNMRYPYVRGAAVCPVVVALMSATFAFGASGAFAAGQSPGAQGDQSPNANATGNPHTQDHPAAAPTSSGDTSQPQPASTADFTGDGANTHGLYDSTRDGSPSGNGLGGGAAVGKPGAGCVGKADNKNPKGQLPGQSPA